MFTGWRLLFIEEPLHAHWISSFDRKSLTQLSSSPSEEGEKKIASELLMLLLHVIVSSCRHSIIRFENRCI